VILMTNAPAQASIHLAGTEAAPFEPGRHRTHPSAGTGAPAIQSLAWELIEDYLCTAKWPGPSYVRGHAQRLKLVWGGPESVVWKLTAQLHPETSQDGVEEGPGAFVLGVADDLLCWALFDDGAFCHEDDAVGYVAGEVHFVGDHHHGHA